MDASIALRTHVVSPRFAGDYSVRYRWLLERVRSGQQARAATAPAKIGRNGVCLDIVLRQMGAGGGE